MTDPSGGSLIQALVQRVHAVLESAGELLERYRSQAALPPVRVVPRVELERYVGTWYEIARLPVRFEAGCVAVTATYQLLEGGELSVINRCRKGTADGPVREVRGKARVVDPQTNARLKVTFFWPFSGDYWIIDLDPDYQHAVIGHPRRRYLWILARQPRLDEATYQAICARIAAQGYDPARLMRTVQP